MDEQNVEQLLKAIIERKKAILATNGSVLTNERKEWLKGTIDGLRHALHLVEKYNKQS